MTAFPNLDVGEQIASKLVRAESIVGDDEQDTILLRGMSDEARAYISSFPWCRTILSSYFGGGVGGGLRNFPLPRSAKSSYCRSLDMDCHGRHPAGLPSNIRLPIAN